MFIVLRTEVFVPKSLQFLISVQFVFLFVFKVFTIKLRNCIKCIHKKQNKKKNEIMLGIQENIKIVPDYVLRETAIWYNRKKSKLKLVNFLKLIFILNTDRSSFVQFTTSKLADSTYTNVIVIKKYISIILKTRKTSFLYYLLWKLERNLT